MRGLVIGLLVFALAGCTDATTYSLGGAFTQDRTDEDLQDFQETVGKYVDGPVPLMESFPEQFIIGGLSDHDCADLRSELAAKDYLQRLSECREETEADDPNEPVSSS